MTLQVWYSRLKTSALKLGQPWEGTPFPAMATLELCTKIDHALPLLWSSTLRRNSSNSPFAIA